MDKAIPLSQASPMKPALGRRILHPDWLLSCYIIQSMQDEHAQRRITS